MACPSSIGAMAAKSVMVSSRSRTRWCGAAPGGGGGSTGSGRVLGCSRAVGGQLVLEVEDLTEQPEPLVGRAAVDPGEELRHLGLPPGVDVGGGHGGLGRGQVVALDVPDEQPVLP